MKNNQKIKIIIPALGEPLALVIVGYFLAPRMAEFLKRQNKTDPRHIRDQSHEGMVDQVHKGLSRKPMASETVPVTVLPPVSVW